MNHSSRTRVALFAWAVAMAAAALVLAAIGYTSRDPDSTLYADLGARITTLPLGSWLAPEWWEWGPAWDKGGLFREHPIGIFVLPALLARTGYPAVQAAYAVGALMSALVVMLAGRVVAPLVADHEAVAAEWACLLLPVAFVYRVRANQEYPVLVLTLLALAATERGRRSARWSAVIPAAACALALVKGIFVVFLPMVCALWLLLVPSPDETDGVMSNRRQADRRPGDQTAWVGIGLSIAAVAMATVIYERAYHAVTGQSFLSYYLRERLAANAGIGDGLGGLKIWRRLSNVGWYGVRLLWFGAPGTLVLALSWPRLWLAASRERGALLFAGAAAALYVGAMSIGANRADRFIFPAYVVLGVAGALVAVRRWGVASRAARSLAALPPYALPTAWLALLLLTVASRFAGSR